jgi:hypothetical protein
MRKKAARPPVADQDRSVGAPDERLGGWRVGRGAVVGRSAAVVATGACT